MNRAADRPHEQRAALVSRAHNFKVHPRPVSLSRNESDAGWFVARRAAGCHFGHHFGAALPLLMKIVSTLNRKRTLAGAEATRKRFETAFRARLVRALTGQIARRKEKPFGRDARGLQKVKGLLARSLMMEQEVSGPPSCLVLRLPSPWAHSLARAVRATQVEKI